MNSLVNEYRKQVPNDPRSDTELTLLLGEQNDVHGQYSGIPDFIQDYEVAKAQKTLSVPPMSAEFGRGFSRGVSSLKSSAYGVGALAADVVGADDLRQALIDRYTEAERESAEQNPAGVARIEDVSGVGDAVRYGLGKVGELAPQLAEAALFGAAGAAAGTAAEPGVGTVAGGAAGVTTGLFARQAARSILKAGVDKLVKGEGRALVKDQLERIAKREVLDSMDPVVETLLRAQTLSMAQNMGQAGANLLNFYGQGAGAIYGNLVNTEGVEDDDAKMAAILGGIGSAIANAPLPILVAKKFFPGVGQEVADKYVKRLLVDAAKEIPVGAGSEFADELIQIAAEKYADPKRRNKPLSDDDLSRLLNATIVGGMAGALVSPVSAIPGPRRQEFDPALEQHFANVPEDRRQQLAALKARLDTKTPSDADIAARRTLTAEEDAFFAVAEPTPSVEAPGAQAQPADPVTEIPAGAEPTAPASLEPEPVAVSPQLQAARQAAAAAIASEPDPLVAAVKSKVALAKEPETKGGDTRETQKEGQEGVLTTAPAAVATQPSAIAEQTGFTYDAKMETMVPNAWHFTDNRADSPTRGLSVAVKQNSTLEDVQTAVAKKVKEGYTPAISKGVPNATQAQSVEAGKAAEKIESPPVEPERRAESVPEVPREPAESSVALRRLKPDDVDVENRGTYDTSSRGRTEAVTVEPAWFVPKTQDLGDLSKRLLTDSTPAWSGRAGEGDAPRKSQTHRLTAILDKETGRVHVVSTFRNNADVRVTKFGDDASTQARVKSRSLSGVLAAGRYEVIGSARSKEVTEYVHDEYPDVATFQRDFADPIERAQRAVQSTASAQEATMAQAAAFRPEEEQADDTEVIEEATGTEATVDYQEPPLADSINLVPAEVRLLAEELPAFEELDELSDFITGGEVSPELLAVIQKVARQDPHFFERVMADGLETVLKDYGYETTQGDEADAGKARPLEQSPVEPAALGIPATQLGGGQRTSGPAPVVESVEDRPRQTEGEEREGQEGTDGGDEVIGAPGGEVKLTLPEPTTLASQVNPAQETLLRSIHEAAAAAGIDVQVVTGALGAGAYDPSNRLLLQVVGETVGRQDVKTAFHEVAHDVFANEPTDVRDRLLRAVDRLSDEALGVDLSADTRIRSSDPANLGQQAVNEERLVDATAERLVQEGFNPAEATGFAQQFVRALKDLYLRAALAVQRMLGFAENPELARRYFENRVKRLLAGDTSPQSYIDFVGARKRTAGTQQVRYFPTSKAAAERLGNDGVLDYDPVPGLSLQAARFNLDNSMRFNLPTDIVGFSRKVELEKRAAEYNHQQELIGRMAKEIEEPLAKAIAGTQRSAEEMVRWALRMTDPKALRDQLKTEKEPGGQPVEFNPETRFADLKAVASVDAVLPRMYANTQALLGRVGPIRAEEQANIAKLEQQVADLKLEHETARQNYTAWPELLRATLKHIRAESRALFREIAGLSNQEGRIHQQLKSLDPKATLKDYAPVFQKLFTGQELKGEKLFTLLDALANDPAVDFTKSITEIRQAISGGGLSDVHPYQALISRTKESNALLATVVAYAKMDARTMALIELRKLKNGQERAAIEEQMKALKIDADKLLGGTEQASVGELARTAKMTERLRAEFQKAQKAYRTKEQALNRARQRLAVVDGIEGVLAKESSELAAGLKIGADVSYRDGMVYNAAKPGMTNADVANAAKKVVLDSTSRRPTKASELEDDLLNMRAFLKEREQRAFAGDASAMDGVYYGVQRQFNEISANATIHVNRSLAQRTMLMLTAMPLGKRLYDAFGELGVNADRRWNRFVAQHSRLVKLAHEFGAKNTRMEDELMKLMPGVTRDALQQNFLTVAKKVMQGDEAKYYAEVYSGDPGKLNRAIFKVIRERLLKDKATAIHAKPVIEQLMPQLERLLKFQHEINQQYLDAVYLAGTGVKDEKLKVFNPATGEFETGVRRHLAVGPYTFSQKLSPDFVTMADALRLSGMGTPTDGGASAFAMLVADAAKIYSEDGPDALRARVAPLFNHAEYGDRVQVDFFRAIAEMTSDSPFQGPVQEDGTRAPVDPALIRTALEDSGTADPVGFAERLYDAQGGNPEGKAAYVAEVLGRLDKMSRAVSSLASQYDVMPSESESGGIRGMSADALIDARSVEHLPASWFDYHSFDQRDLLDLSERVAAQSAFGRGAEGMAADIDRIGTEIKNAKTRLAAARKRAERAMPGAKPKQIEAAMEKEIGKDYQRLTTLTKRAPQLVRSVKEMSDYFRRGNSTDGTVKLWTRFAQTLGNMMVNNPGSAIYQMAQLLDYPLRYGVSPATLSATSEAVSATGKETAASFGQAVGIQMLNGSANNLMFNRVVGRDPKAMIKVRDAIDPLTGESGWAHGLRAVNEVMGFGVNRFGEGAESVILRPGQPFVMSTMIADKAITFGMWNLAKRFIGNGMDFYRANPDKLADPKFKLTPEQLKIGKLDRETFRKVKLDMDRWSLDYDAMVRSALQRGDGQFFGDFEADILHKMAMSEVSSQANPATMSLGAYNNSVLRFLMPLLSWSFRRTLQVGSLGLNAEGQRDMKALAHGMAGLAFVTLGGLGVSALAGFYYDDLLGKKRGMRPLLGAPDPKQYALALLEHTARTGSFGFFGELANGVVNVGTGADNRIISMDQRVVALSAAMTVQRVISSLIHQGEADYAHVVRPMIMAMGGNGTLQYLQLANRLTGSDTVESRMAARMNAQNYLRVVGRVLEKDVRTFSGGGYSNPTPISASLTRMELAAYANDSAGFRRAYEEAVARAREAGNEDPVDHVKRAYAGRNPLKQVFRTPLSEAEYQQILAALPDDGRQDVSQAVNLFNSFAESIGARPFEGKAEKKKAFLTPPSRPRYSTTEMRNRAVEALLSR